MVFVGREIKRIWWIQWSLISQWQVGSVSFGILSTKYSFVNLWFNMCINEIWHCVACRGFYAIKSTKPNKTKLEYILSLPKNLSFSLKSDQINLFTNIWSNRIKNYRPPPKKNPCPKTRIEVKTNLTFLGIKWPIDVDMPLNKTQTHIPSLECHPGNI